MHIGLMWKNLEPKGSTEVYSSLDFQEDCKDELYIHPVTNAGKKMGFAFCLKTVDSNKILLNYEPFPYANENQGMLLGQTKLEIAWTPELKIIKACWKSENSHDFEEFSFEQIDISKRSKPSAEIYALLTVEGQKASFDKSLYEKINAAFPDKPKKISVSTTIFARNPVVVAEALAYAKEHCEMCNQKAPFTRKDGTPYLEVHHIKRLADGGKDTIDNAVAICPNCHRQMHYGIDADKFVNELRTKIAQRNKDI